MGPLKGFLVYLAFISPYQKTTPSLKDIVRFSLYNKLKSSNHSNVSSVIKRFPNKMFTLNLKCHPKCVYFDILESAPKKKQLLYLSISTVL